MQSLHISSQRSIIFLIFLIIPLPFLCAQNFLEVAQQVGITSTIGNPWYGGGISFVDFNKDGFDDLTFGTEAGANLLFYENQNGSSFTQVDIGITNFGDHKQVLWADIDNDNDLDFFVVNRFDQNRLFENDGSMNFTDITGSCGITIENDPGSSAAFCDVNNDSYLDLYVVNYCGVCTQNYFYLNNGDNTFTDVTSSSGAIVSQGPGLGVGFLDIDNDMDPDMYLAVDKLSTNYLFENLGGNFSDISSSSGTNIAIDAMNVGMGDFNNDHLLDIYVTNGFDGNVLFRNNGDGTFTDIAVSSGTAFNAVCWGGSFSDFNNDGYEDLYVCASYPQTSNPNKLYINDGDETFTPYVLPNDQTISYSNTFGDFNNDGKQDIVVSAIQNEPILLYENQESNNTKFLKVKLNGTSSNRDGIGSWLEVFYNGTAQYRYTYCGNGYIGQNSQNIHFGLGSSTSIDSLIIKWPSGTIDKYYDLSPNVTLNAIESCTSCGTCAFHDSSEYHSAFIEPDVYHQNEIESSGNVLAPVWFKATQCIELQNDFTVEHSTGFTAEIKECFN